MKTIIILAMCLAAPSAALGQVDLAPLPAWMLHAIDLAETMAAEPATQCPDGTLYIPTFKPGEGLRYECRPNQDTASRDKIADRLTELNAGLIVIDSTLTG